MFKKRLKLTICKIPGKCIWKKADVFVKMLYFRLNLCMSWQQYLVLLSSLLYSSFAAGPGSLKPEAGTIRSHPMCCCCNVFRSRSKAAPPLCPHVACWYIVIMKQKTQSQLNVWLPYRTVTVTSHHFTFWRLPLLFCCPSFVIVLFYFFPFVVTLRSLFSVSIPGVS